MSKRTYTPSQTAARLAWTREWRKRNKERIQAYERNYADRRKQLARKRYKADPEKHRAKALIRSRARAEHRASYQREYRLRMLAQNPNWNREKWARFSRANPGYQAKYRRQRRLQDAWRKWSKALKRSRDVLPAIENRS